MTQVAVFIAMMTGFTVLASLAGAQEPPPLDPAGVRGVRYFMRDDARTALWLGSDTLLDWHAMGLARSSELVTPAQVRTAFEGNVIQAERRFAQPFGINGALHSVARRADRQVVVTFVEGGLADNQRRALARLGARGDELEPAQILGSITGGRIHAGATAVLSPEHEDAVASWTPGMKVALHCRSALNVPLAVLLSDCLPAAVIVAQADRLADTQSDLLLARKPLAVSFTPERGKNNDPAKASRELLVMGYLHGLLGRNCPDKVLAEWIRCSSRIFKQAKSEQSEAAPQEMIKDFKLHFNLPEPVIPQSKTSLQRNIPETRR